MARVSAWTIGAIIWGDKTLQAGAFADDQNPHTHPVAADLDWNSLRNDYVSLTTSAAQTLQATADVVGLTHQDFTTPTKNIEEWLNASGVRIVSIGTRNALNVGGPGLNIYPTSNNDVTTGIWFIKQSTGSLIKVFSYDGTNSRVIAGSAGNDYLFSFRDFFHNGRNFAMANSFTGGFADWRGNANTMPHRHFQVDTITNVPNVDMTTGMIRVNPAGGPLAVDQLETFDAATATVVPIIDGDHTTAIQSTIPPAIGLSGASGTISNVVASQDHTHQAVTFVEDSSGVVVSSRPILQIIGGPGINVSVSDDSVNTRAIVQIGIGQVASETPQLEPSMSGPVMFPYLPTGKTIDLYVPMQGAKIGMGVTGTPLYPVETGLVWNTFIQQQNLAVLRVSNNGSRPLYAGNRVWRIDLKP